MNVLIVDDHPMTVSGYRDSLSGSALFSSPMHFFKACNCEEAYFKLQTSAVLDLALIDFGLPPFPLKDIFSGSDLATVVRKLHPQCKVIIITAHTEVITVYNLFKNTKPDGLIIKNDLTPENLPRAVVEVLSGAVFQSSTVKKVLQELWKKELMIDDSNREILMYLSKGNKIKDIERSTSLSMSTIQRRIAHMKDAFNVAEDSTLVKEAILQGFL
jgi:DNA-binding NarL/FixJ family response regulator